MRSTYHSVIIAKALFSSLTRRVGAKRIMPMFARRHWHKGITRGISCLLVISLLATTTPATPTILVAVAGEWKTDLLFWSKSSDWPDTWYRALLGQFAQRAKPQEEQQERDARISRIEIQPGKRIVQVGEQWFLSAIAFDSQDVPVGGVSFEWRSDYRRSDQQDGILPGGAFIASVPGQYVITAAVGGLADSVKVNVVPKPETGNQPLIIRSVSSDSIDEPSAKPPRGVQRAHARPMYQTQFIDGDPAGWNSTNKPAAFIPQNERGETPGRSTVAANSNNFRIQAPVVTLPGRGLDLKLSLLYNSRVWSKSNNANNQIIFNADRDPIAPGWTLSLDRMINMVDAGAFLIRADGTRHSFAGQLSIDTSNGERYFNAITTDGSFIEYGLITRGVGTGTVDTYGRARYPDGTTIYFGGALSIENSSNVYVLRPLRHVNSNGNHILYNYGSGRLNTIVDTLNRVITLHYDSNQLLTAITAAGLKDDNGVVVNRTLVRLHYKQLTLGATFQGLTPVVTTPTPWVLDAIYYPATGSGNWFGDSNSYSSYGMIKKVSEHKSMTFSATLLTEQGTVGAGTVTREFDYNYPATASNLSDAPAYDTVTESWEGSTSGTAVTQFDTVDEGTTRKVTTTLPDLNKSIEYSNLKPGQWDDGLVYKNEIVEGTTVLQTVTSTWQQGHDGAPRVQRRDFTNSRNQTHYQTYGYGEGTGIYFFNQVAELQEFGYSGNLIRKTKWTYNRSTISRVMTGAPPAGGDKPGFMPNLVTSVEVFDGNDTKLARTDYNYDDYNEQNWNPWISGSTYSGNLIDTPGVTGFNTFWDPRVWGLFYHLGGLRLRGNITSVVTYPNALDTASAITTSIIYDITGNVRTVTTGNKQNKFDYVLGTDYAYPTTDTFGSSDTNSTIKITTTCTYDFNTGLKLSATDANSRPTLESYYLDSWRHKQTTAPTGATVLDEYNDVALSVTSTSKGSDGTIAEKTVTKFNGRGQTIRIETLAPNDAWDLKDAQYDDLGRGVKESLPYRTGQTPGWIETNYDALSRVTKKVAPDLSESRLFYNEAARPSSASTTPGDTARSVDAWGRERWVLTDSRRRLIEVVEPDPNGSGSVTAAGNLKTKYTYDAVDNLTQVDHDAQQRRFRYDSLGRLTHQKMAEADATLNDAGAYVGAATGQWSSVFSYDTSSNIVWSVDARGVRTISTYNNDPLNRLQSISYDTSGAGAGQTIHAAATITFAYMPTGDIARLQSVAAANVSTETFDYDTEGRLKEANLVFTNRLSYPALTEFTYDSLSRLTNTRYPAQYGVTGTPRKLVQHDYDVASRPTGLKVNGADYASQIVYNAASQPTSVKLGAGTNQTTDTYDYDPVTLLLNRQRVDRGATHLLDLNYGYLRQATSSGRTGQLTTIVNNLNANKNRNYTYDALGRLKQATGGSATAPIWTQSYSYDRYGNRLSVSATGNSAWNRKLPNDPRIRPEAQVAEASTVPAPQAQRSFSHHASGSAVTKPLAPPSVPVFTDDPLNDPQNPQKTTIKAIHITELRDAINALRGLLGLAAYSWTESVSTGNQVKRDHISEMRTALDQGLGAPAGGYSAGLAVGQPILAVHVQELRDRIKASWSVSLQIPRDGHASLAYSPGSNRITTTGFEYDAAGNQTKVVLPDGLTRFFEYDAANRLAKVRDENQVVIATYTYGHGNRRLIAQAGDNSNQRTYFVLAGDVVLTEYTETPSTPTTPGWSRNYLYLEGQLLATQDKNGAAELIEFHHPDRLGTRLVTRPDGTWYEQVTLPFGVPISAESNGASNRRFTTYDRNTLTALDYANARSYAWNQGRFTQVDPVGMAAVDLSDPQTLNLYAYCANDPINGVDPSGNFGFSISFGGGGFGFGFGGGSGSTGGFLAGLLGGLLNFGLGVLGAILGGQGNSTFFGFPFIGFPFAGFPQQQTRPPDGQSITTRHIEYNFVSPGFDPSEHPGDRQAEEASKNGYGKLVWGHRNVIIAECQGFQVGIISDITVAVIKYSDTPTAKKLSSTTQPRYGSKEEGDQRGHIIGWALGGPPIPENLVWMAGRVNNGNYKAMENLIRKTLTEHKDWKAYVVVNNFYPPVSPLYCYGGSFRPIGGLFTFYVVKPKVLGRTRIGSLKWRNTN